MKKYAHYLVYALISLAIIYIAISSDTNSKNNDCELFSEAVAICPSQCTKTSCESISRDGFLKSIDKNLSILEIGPYVNPIFQGNKVKYFDVLDADAIKRQVTTEDDAGTKNYVESNADLTKVPQIDYVNPNGDMSSIKEKFDIVFSAHNIEHQIDLITHLNQVANLLDENGKFYLIIPDKRYCFDHFIPESPLSDIIDNYYNKGSSHSLRTILAMNCETTHNNPWLHWRGKHGEVKGKSFKCYEEASKIFKENGSEYINAHRWRFTPAQFEFIINELYEMGLISLKVEKVYLTEKNTQEFAAILSKGK